MTDIVTCLRLAADSLSAARICPSEADLAREYAAMAVADLPTEIAVQVECALACGEHRALDDLANALEPPAAPTPQPKSRRPRKPTLASVAKQASKAALEVARYEVRPDGTVVVVTGKSESTEPNPWLDDLKVTKQ